MTRKRIYKDAMDDCIKKLMDKTKNGEEIGFYDYAAANKILRMQFTALRIDAKNYTPMLRRLDELDMLGLDEDFFALYREIVPTLIKNREKMQELLEKCEDLSSLVRDHAIRHRIEDRIMDLERSIDALDDYINSGCEVNDGLYFSYK